MWEAKNKVDLMIEVWEKLDCESVGRSEIEAIETVLRDRFGAQAVDSPMRIARLLADEGAVLRHSELMELYVARRGNTPYSAEFRNLFRFDTFASAVSTINRIENLRNKFESENDREGIRLVRERAIAARDQLAKGTPAEVEIAGWLTVWLQTPAAFTVWLKLRRASAEFKQRFPDQI